MEECSRVVSMVGSSAFGRGPADLPARGGSELLFKPYRQWAIDVSTIWGSPGGMRVCPSDTQRCTQ